MAWPGDEDNEAIANFGDKVPNFQVTKKVSFGTTLAHGWSDRISIAYHGEDLEARRAV